MRLIYAIGDCVGLLVITILTAGCLGVPATADLRPFVAASIGYASLASGTSPSPVPSVCRTCGGRKVLGDGRVQVPCPDCTKKPTKEAPPCPTGICPLPTVR